MQSYPKPIHIKNPKFSIIELEQSDHLFVINSLVQNTLKTIKHIRVIITSGSTINSTWEGKFVLSMLLEVNINSYILPHTKKFSHISMVKFFDVGYQYIYNKHEVMVK